MSNYDCSPIQLLTGPDGFVVTPVVSVYPDNAPIVTFPTDHIRGETTIEAMLVRALTFTDFAAAMFLADAFEWRGTDVKKLVIPFLPGARQDRMNSKGDFLFTAKSVAQMINQRCFEKVVTLDPHSEVITGLINNCEVTNFEKVWKMAPVRLFGKTDYDYVVAPDAGAEKRAGIVSKILGIPVLHAWKNRNVADGSISGFGCEPFEWHPEERPSLLLVDDICDGGGTFVGLGELLRPIASRLDLFVTHGIFSKGASHLLAMFNNIYTTDSIARRPPAGVEVINVSKSLFYA